MKFLTQTIYVGQEPDPTTGYSPKYKTDLARNTHQFFIEVGRAVFLITIQESAQLN
jgi:hypothetical protein